MRPPSDIDSVNEPFAPHPYVIVAPPSHPLAAKNHIPMATLIRERFVVREKDSDTWQSMAQAFGGWLPKLKVGMEIRGDETIKQAVLAGMGISFVSAHTVTLERSAGSLVILDVQGFPVMLNWYVVHRRKKRLPPVAAAFKDFLLTNGATLIESITHFGTQAGTHPVKEAKTAHVRKHRREGAHDPSTANAFESPERAGGTIKKCVNEKGGVAFRLEA